MKIFYHHQRLNIAIYPLIEKKLKQLILNHPDIRDIYKYLDQIQNLWAKYIKTKYSVFTDSGTSCIWIGLSVLGVKKNDEVILPVTAHPATVLSILGLSAKPVFIDINPDLSPNLKDLKRKISKKTKVIIISYMYGKSLNPYPILELAKQHNLKILEDACQAHGSEYQNKKLGSFGDIGCFSFNFRKTISTFGEGGAINFNSKKIKTEIHKRTLYKLDSQLIISTKRPTPYFSYNSLPFIEIKTKLAKKIEQNKLLSARIYGKYLSKIKQVKLIKDKPYEKTIWQNYLIYAKKRDKLARFLERNGIEGAEFQFEPVYTFKIFKPFIKKQCFPGAKYYHKHGLALPIFPLIKPAEIKYVIQKINQFYSNSK